MHKNTENMKERDHLGDISINGRATGLPGFEATGSG
jgi:hypothetical protein